MAWAGNVIAGGDGGIRADENRAGVFELFQYGIVVACLQIYVLGGELISERDQLVQRITDDNGAALFQGFLDGWQGFSIAWLGAFYTFLRYAKVRELKLQKQTK